MNGLIFNKFQESVKIFTMPFSPLPPPPPPHTHTHTRQWRKVFSSSLCRGRAWEWDYMCSGSVTRLPWGPNEKLT